MTEMTDIQINTIASRFATATEDFEYVLVDDEIISFAHAIITAYLTLHHKP